MVPSNARVLTPSEPLPRQCARCLLDQHVVAYLGLPARGSAAYAVIMASPTSFIGSLLFL